MNARIIVHLMTIVVAVAFTFEVFALIGSNVKNTAQMKKRTAVKALRKSNTRDRLNGMGEERSLSAGRILRNINAEAPSMTPITIICDTVAFGMAPLS